MTTSVDPVTKFLSRFGLRDLGHAAVAYGATILATLNLTSASTVRDSLVAAIPAVAAVAFRQLFPHVTVTAAEVSTAVSDVEHVLAKVNVPASVTSVVGQVGNTVVQAAGDLHPAIPVIAVTAAAVAPAAAPPAH